MHEYGVHAAVDPHSMRLTGIKADPRVLPFETCPAAAENVDLLVGEPMRTLRSRVIERQARPRHRRPRPTITGLRNRI